MGTGKHILARRGCRARDAMRLASGADDVRRVMLAVCRRAWLTRPSRPCLKEG